MRLGLKPLRQIQTLKESKQKEKKELTRTQEIKNEERQHYEHLRYQRNHHLQTTLSQHNCRQNLNYALRRNV